MLEMIVPLTVFGLASAITPGPNNLMMTASGSAFGFRRSIPHMLGISIGFPVMIFSVGLGLGEIFIKYSQVHLALKYVGAAYLFYLAWRIAQSGQAEAADASGRPLTFLEAAAFQWVNPKAWMMAVGSIPAFTTVGGNYYAELGVITLMWGLFCIPACLIWCLFGVAIRRLIRTPETARIVNLVLAAMVALSIVPLFV